eukprot:5359896-Pyramimonas_sp.AAC.1
MLVLGFGFVVLGNPANWRNIGGIGIALVGMVSYAHYDSVDQAAVRAPFDRVLGSIWVTFWVTLGRTITGQGIYLEEDLITLQGMVSHAHYDSVDQAFDHFLSQFWSLLGHFGSHKYRLRMRVLVAFSSLFEGDSLVS